MTGTWEWPCSWVNQLCRYDGYLRETPEPFTLAFDLTTRSHNLKWHWCYWMLSGALLPVCVRSQILMEISLYLQFSTDCGKRNSAYFFKVASIKSSYKVCTSFPTCIIFIRASSYWEKEKSLSFCIFYIFWNLENSIANYIGQSWDPDRFWLYHHRV